MNILLALILIVLLFQLGLSCILLIGTLRYKRKALDFITSQDETKPSQFGIIINGIGDVIAGKIKGALMGVSSGASRVEKSAMEEIISSGLENSNPLFSILGKFPKLKKLMVKNPEIAQMALNKISGVIAPKEPNAGGKIALPWKDNFE